MKTKPLILSIILLSQALASKGAIVASDDFEPGIDWSQWADSGGMVVATNYGGSMSGANSLWFSGTGSRFAAMGPFDTTPGGWLAFWLRIPDEDNTAPYFYDPDMPEEGVVLEYSVDSGATWVNWTNYLTAQPFWNLQLVPIPPGAQSAATQIRWRQLQHSSPIGDNWALDDVAVMVSTLAPIITRQPISLVVAVGGTASFDVGLLESDPFSTNGNSTVWIYQAKPMPS